MTAEQLPMDQRCPHCNLLGCSPRPIDAEWFFCPFCGKGLKPLPCEHPSNTGNPGKPTECELVEPLIECVGGLGNAIRVKCPKCGVKGHIWQRARWAIDEWNQWTMGRGVNMPDKSDTSVVEKELAKEHEELLAKMKE